MSSKKDDSAARRQLHAQLVAQVAAREKKRSLLLISMSAPALGLLALIVYRFVSSLP